MRRYCKTHYNYGSVEGARVAALLKGFPEKGMPRVEAFFIAFVGSAAIIVSWFAQ